MSQEQGPNWNEIKKQLAAPFSSTIIRWKAKDHAVNCTADELAGRAKALAYITARDVMNRLDEAVGVENWSDAYKVVFADGAQFGVECTLTVLGISKTGVGYAEEGDEDCYTLKAAYSDALKRAAVKWGIARYLYYLPVQWVEHDGTKFVRMPELPVWAAGGEQQGSNVEPTESNILSMPSPSEMTTAQARATVLPFGTRDHPEWKGKTLGEVSSLNGDLIAWLANEFAPTSDGGRTVQRAARVITEHNKAA